MIECTLCRDDETNGPFIVPYDPVGTALMQAHIDEHRRKGEL